MTIRRLQHALLHARLLALCLLVIFFFPSLNPDVLPTAATASSKDLKPNDPYALIFGTVWGPDDRPVYGITVKIRRAQDKKPKWQVYSDHSGEFAQRIAAGKADYIVWADLKGVKFTDGQPLHLVEEVPVHVEYDERVDIGLHLKR